MADSVDVTDLRWRWGQALASLDATTLPEADRQTLSNSLEGFDTGASQNRAPIERALAASAPTAREPVDTFMRETVGELLDLVDERNRLAAKIDELKALLGG